MIKLDPQRFRVFLRDRRSKSNQANQKKEFNIYVLFALE
jgi:hypothetical protein